MKPKDEAAELLEKAADAIDVHGWRQNNFGTKITGFCIIGALRHADNDQHSSAFYDALYQIGDRIVFHWGWIAHWNDNPDRTQGEVTDVLRHTAKDLRNAS
jgi:hypothetical protein